MNQIITIQKSVIGSDTVNSVNARELHSNIESKQKFADWIKNRIEQYRFKEGEDFFISLGKTPNGGRPLQEYIISLDMAKELAMVENTPKGREVRKYFIEVEKQFAVGLTQYKEVQSQVDVCIRELSSKSLEADRFRAKYYETLELTNKLLVEKIETIEKTKQEPSYYLQGKALTDEEKTKILELHKKGYPYVKIAKMLNRGTETVSRFVKKSGGVR